MARYVSVSDYLEYSSPANLESAASIFIRLKPNWSSGDSTQHYLWSYGTSGDPECAIQRYSDNNIYAGWYAGGGRIVISDAGLFSSGTWVNILLDYDDSANTQHLYFNNTLAGSLSDAFAVQTGLSKLRIGLGTQGSRPTDADVAEFARWDHVLDSTERATLQSTGNPACLSTGLVHHYKILGNDNPEPDEIGSEDLTLVGSPAQSTHPTVGSCSSGSNVDCSASIVGRAGVKAASSVLRSAPAKLNARSTVRSAISRAVAAHTEIIARSTVTANGSRIAGASAKLNARSTVQSTSSLVRGASVRIQSRASMQVRASAWRSIVAQLQARSGILCGAIEQLSIAPGRLLSVPYEQRVFRVRYEDRTFRVPRT